MALGNQANADTLAGSDGIGMMIMDNQSMMIALNLTFTVTNASETMDRTNATRIDLIRKDLLHILLPVIVILGTIGNLLALGVLIRRRMRTKSVYFYLTVLACADTSVLYLSAFRNWIRLLTGFKFLHMSVFSCKFLIFLIIFSQHLSAWLIVMLTFDRFLSIWHPFYATSFCTVKRSRILTMVLMLVLTLYNLHIFWTFDLIKNDNGNIICSIDSDDLFFNVYEYLKAITYCLFPSVIVLILNSCIIYKVVQRKSEVEKFTTCDHIHALTTRRVTRRKNRVTSMLLVISFTWLALTTPYGIISVTKSLIEPSMDPSSRKLMRTICFLLFYLNHSINFYLYCLTGQKIRKEFVGLLIYFCRCASRYRGSLKGTSVNIKKTQKTQRTPIMGNDAELKVISANVQLRKLSARVELCRLEAQGKDGDVKLPSSGSS